MILHVYPQATVYRFTWKLPNTSHIEFFKINVAYMSSWRSSKEGDFPLFILEKREILHKTIRPHLFRPSTFKFRLKFWNDEIFPPLNGLQLFILCKNIVFLYFVDILLTNQCIFIGNSIQFLIFKEKIIGSRRGKKRGRFPLLGGRWMFRREMGSKRGSLPPKEGDLTCMMLFF